jgi:AhpC/TSA family
MSLEDKLAAIRAAARQRIPPETREIMERAVRDLRGSGILDRVVKVGYPAPEFTLPNRDGKPVALTMLLAREPVVLSFFRGRW